MPALPDAGLLLPWALDCDEELLEELDEEDEDEELEELDEALELELLLEELLGDGGVGIVGVVGLEALGQPLSSRHTDAAPSRRSVNLPDSG